MDTDSKFKKYLVKLYRTIRLRADYAGMGLLSEKNGNARIAEYLQSKDTFMVGRFGAVEMHLVSKWMHGKEFSEEEKEQALYAAGIFPNTNDILTRFCQQYTQSMNECDLLGVWEVTGEKNAIKKYCNNVKLMPSRSIEPYYFAEPWSENLKGKRILVIHPFVDSIEKQIKNSSNIWPGKNVLPEFESVSFIKAVQSNAGGETEFEDWFAALKYMENEIDKCEFDVAIIGAGAYGFPLCAYVKSKGKCGIQMSGATQIMFGIKGKRWDNHPIISGFYNDAWIRPSDQETPPQIQKVEGGSYW